MSEQEQTQSERPNTGPGEGYPAGETAPGEGGTGDDDSAGTDDDD